VTGLLQTEDYARALISTLPGVTGDTVAARVAARMERQRRVLYRADPPRAWFIVDELSLYREVGGREVMARQVRHLAEAAALPQHHGTGPAGRGSPRQCQRVPDGR
jgi:hypothetical protein